MKPIKQPLFFLTTAFSICLSGCSDLDVPVESEFTPGNFPGTPSEYIAATGPVYSQLAVQYNANRTGLLASYATEYWQLQELSTDAAIIPARDGNFDDGGQFRQLHQHTWSPDHVTVTRIWQWGYGGINIANRVIGLFESTPNSPTKTASLAELRAMRALYHYYMMDLYGNVPIITVFGSTNQPTNAKRAEVYAFIESELKAVMPNLSTSAGALTYGRVTKWMAQALLAKMYLNAEVYTGQPRYRESLAACDTILTKAGNLYTLDADYQSIFNPDNGPQIRDVIFAIPYDGTLIKGNYFTRFATHPLLMTKYNIPNRPSIAMSTIKEFHAKFNLPGDVRNDTWLIGKQFDFSGRPITQATTKRGLDATYAGADGSAAVTWQLEFSPDLTLVNAAKMDVGNDILAQAKGIRSVKFYPDKNSAPDRYQGNDLPVFRLADIYLMKAEAILRGVPATTVGSELQTPVVLVNKLRARAKTTPVTTVDLNLLLDERVRELSWEGWRRNDLIRFGQFENVWGFKDNKEVFRRLYPIPANERSLNPSLVQNPGY